MLKGVACDFKPLQDVRNRPEAAGCLEHPWFTKHEVLKLKIFGEVLERFRDRALATKVSSDFNRFHPSFYLCQAAPPPLSVGVTQCPGSKLSAWSFFVRYEKQWSNVSCKALKHMLCSRKWRRSLIVCTLSDAKMTIQTSLAWSSFQAIFLLIAHMCTAPALQELRAIFTHFDVLNRGALSLSHFREVLFKSGMASLQASSGQVLVPLQCFCCHSVFCLVFVVPCCAMLCLAFKCWRWSE